MRSQPMIQAGNSPIVAYENVYAEPATGTLADSSLRNRRPVVTPSASLIDCSTGLVLMRLIHRSRDVPSTRERSPDVAGRNQQVPEKYRTQDMAGGLLGGLGLDFVGDPGDRLGGVAGGILGP